MYLGIETIPLISQMRSLISNTSCHKVKSISVASDINVFAKIKNFYSNNSIAGYITNINSVIRD